MSESIARQHNAPKTSPVPGAAAPGSEDSLTACDRSWNSPTTLYLARRLRALSDRADRRLTVLDLGCGDGTILEQLAPDGHDLFGYDLGDPTYARSRLQARLAGDIERRVRRAPDERTIPFGDEAFDVVISNQVFEHVKFLDAIAGECARVLRPGGVLLAIFPLATCPVEWHLKVPFAHWLPPGQLRVRYLQLFYASGIRPRLGGASALATAVSQDAFLRDRTYYRFINEVLAVGGHHFQQCAFETDQVVRAKSDLMRASDQAYRRAAGSVLRRAEGPIAGALSTYLYNAAICFSGPVRSPYSRAIEPPRVDTSNLG